MIQQFFSSNWRPRHKEPSDDKKAPMHDAFIPINFSSDPHELIVDRTRGRCARRVHELPGVSKHSTHCCICTQCTGTWIHWLTKKQTHPLLVCTRYSGQWSQLQRDHNSNCANWQHRRTFRTVDICARDNHNFRVVGREKLSSVFQTWFRWSHNWSRFVLSWWCSLLWSWCVVTTCFRFFQKKS